MKGVIDLRTKIEKDIIYFLQTKDLISAVITTERIDITRIKCCVGKKINTNVNDIFKELSECYDRKIDLTDLDDDGYVTILIHKDYFDDNVMPMTEEEDKIFNKMLTFFKDSSYIIQTETKNYVHIHSVVSISMLLTKFKWGVINLTLEHGSIYNGRFILSFDRIPRLTPRLTEAEEKEQINEPLLALGKIFQVLGENAPILHTNKEYVELICNYLKEFQK